MISLDRLRSVENQVSDVGYGRLDKLLHKGFIVMKLFDLASSIAVIAWAGSALAGSVLVDLSQYSTGSRSTGANGGLTAAATSG